MKLRHPVLTPLILIAMPWLVMYVTLKVAHKS